MSKDAVMITILAPLPRDQLRAAENILDSWGNPVGEELPDPAGALGLAERLHGTGIHFISAHALDLDDEARLLIELSADGPEEDAVRLLASEMDAEFARLLALASDRGEASIEAYLLDHRRAIGVVQRTVLGLPFCGTPGLSVEDIRRQAELARFVRKIVTNLPARLSALERLEAVRAEVEQDAGHAWVRGSVWSSPTAAPSPTLFSLVRAMAPGFVSIFLRWALWIAALAVIVATAIIAWHWQPPVRHLVGGERTLLGLAWIVYVGKGLICGAIVGIVAVLAWAGIVVLSLLRLEARDAPDARAPDHAVNRSMFALENQIAQNHMISITRRKPGAVRRVTLRFAFWIIGELAARKYRPGFLGGIGSIHFARWFAVPGTDRLVFVSNYGGSWESYLEDFITLASEGLTGIWSNTVGFPRSRLLFGKGATDGEWFKRYARRSMIPTRFWYSAYPTLTTANIRANAAICRGLAGIRTEDEARGWLALFGSAVRPTARLETGEIQSLVFGGLSFLHSSTLLLVKLSEDVARAQAWLDEITPHIAYNDGNRFKRDGRSKDAGGKSAPTAEVISLALSATGLRRLGLDEQAVNSFPTAFLDGMAEPGRSRILGDQDPETWEWGGRGEPDVALVVFAAGPDPARPALASLIEAVSARHGCEIVHEVVLSCGQKQQREPFGFVDGISQPAIRDTYKGLRNSDPLHIVEAGEFVLGYPDNRGTLPPGPELDPRLDPYEMLPLGKGPDGAETSPFDRPRALADNGSFLVIRQLEQDVGGFRAYCEGQAKRLVDRLDAPELIDADFIAAKMIGRWKNGAPLVRYPYSPTRESPNALLNRAVTSPEDGAGIGPSPPADPAVPDNDFLYGTEDPQGFRCPYGAHVRRANPRDSLNPGSQDQIDISNRHRLLRVGRRYADRNGEGLMFMCLNGDLERQFEFIQQTWLGSTAFHGLSCEQDPLLGSGTAGRNGFTIPSRDGPIALEPLQRFVTVKGGGYFFLPSLRLVRYLAGARSAARAETPLSLAKRWSMTQAPSQPSSMRTVLRSALRSFGRRLSLQPANGTDEESALDRRHP